MDASKFRKLSLAQLDAKLPSLQVLARAKSNDKRILTVRLNGKGLPKSKKAWCMEHNVGEDRSWRKKLKAQKAQEEALRNISSTKMKKRGLSVEND